MAFKQYKGDRMKSALPQTVSDADLDRYDSAHNDYWKGKRSTWDDDPTSKTYGTWVDESNTNRFARIKKKNKLKPGDIKKNLNLQKKWAKTHKTGSDTKMSENPTPEERAQKNIEDDMYSRAQRLGQHGPTTAGRSAQGIHYERVSRGKDVYSGETHADYAARVERNLRTKI